MKRKSLKTVYLTNEETLLEPLLSSFLVIAVNPWQSFVSDGTEAPLCPQQIRWALGGPCRWLKLGRSEHYCHRAALCREKQRRDHAMHQREQLYEL